MTMGGPVSLYEGVYEAVSEEIDKMSQECFNRHNIKHNNFIQLFSLLKTAV